MPQLHEFQAGICRVCGEQLDYLVDNALRDQSLIGPKLPVDSDQLAFQLTMNVFG